MRANDMRELDSAAILDKLEASRREMFNLKLSFRTNTLDNPGQILNLRKDIARMLTVLRERELAAALVQIEGAGPLSEEKTDAE